MTSRLVPRSLLVLVLPLILIGAPLRARAAPPVTVYIVPAGCSSEVLDIDSFARTVSIELRADGVDRIVVSGENPTAEPRVSLDDASAVIAIAPQPCNSDAREIEITIADLATRKTVQRKVAMSDLDRPARPRAIALAIAELLRASWAELGVPPVLPVPSAVALPLKRSERAPPAKSPPFTNHEVPVLELGTTMEGRFFPAYATTLLGVKAAASVSLARDFPLRARVDLSALFGTSYDPLGTISTRLLCGGAGLVVAKSWGPLGVELGPQLELGDGWLSGNATSANVLTRSGSAPVLTLALELGIHVLLWEKFFAIADVDLGGALVSFGAQTASGRVGGFGGLMTGAALGVGPIVLKRRISCSMRDHEPLVSELSIAKGPIAT